MYLFIGKQTTPLKENQQTLSCLKKNKNHF